MDTFAIDFTYKITGHPKQCVLTFQRDIRNREYSAIVQNFASKAFARLSKCLAVQFEFKNIHGSPRLERTLLGKSRNGLAFYGNDFFRDIGGGVILFCMSIYGSFTFTAGTPDFNRFIVFDPLALFANVALILIYHIGSFSIAGFCTRREFPVGVRLVIGIADFRCAIGCTGIITTSRKQE